MLIEEKELKRCLDEASGFPEFTPEEVETAAHALEGYNYVPTLLRDVDGFIRFTRQDLTDEITLTGSLTEQEAGKIFGRHPEEELRELVGKHLDLLMYHYRLLVRLRRNEPEAWDEITELYDDD